ncbi:hypothetical protein Tco_0144195 [Tanacetum coccineum]
MKALRKAIKMSRETPGNWRPNEGTGNILGVPDEYYNLPPRTISPDPVAIVASRAVDPVGSPSSTTIDQDEQSTSTLPTNQEIQSQVTHQGPVPQFMAPDRAFQDRIEKQVQYELHSIRQTTSLELVYKHLATKRARLRKGNWISEESFALVARLVAVWIFVAYDCKHKVLFQSTDEVKMDFLNGPLEGEFIC